MPYRRSSFSQRRPRKSRVGRKSLPAGRALQVRQQKTANRFAGYTRPLSSRLSRPWGRYLSSDPVPPMRFTKNTFTTNGTVTTVSGSTLFSASPVTLKLNAVYHVDGSTNSDGYTLMSNFYWKYKVYAVEIEISVNEGGAAYMMAGALVTGPGETNHIDTMTVQSLSENPLGVCKFLPDTGRREVIFRQYFNIADIMGETQQAFMNDLGTTYGTCSFIGATPDQYCLLEVGVASSNSTGSADTAKYQIKLVQHVKWYDRKSTLTN